MQNVSNIANEPVVVQLSLVSLTRSGMLRAAAMIGQAEGVSVLAVERPGDRSQSSWLAAPSSGAISQLAYRLAEIGAIIEVRVQRWFVYPALEAEGRDRRRSAG